MIEDGVTGFIAEDEAGFVRAIDLLVRDRERQAAMSRAARQYAMGISWDAVFEKVWGAYEHAVGTRG